MTVQASEMRYVVAHGTAGVADIISQEGVYARIDKSGNLTRRLPGSEFEFGYQIPPELRTGVPDGPYVGIVVNNPQVMVVSLTVNGGSQRFLDFRKADKTWHVIPAKSDLYPRLRGFGGFVAVTEAQTKKAVASQRTQSQSGVSINQAVKEGEQSAGRTEWRRVETRRGPNMVERFENAEVVYPGRLHLYDVASERLYTIPTNQGDSEILLVQNGAVYYRVSDRLYSAPVTDAGIGTARLLATAEEIRDAHWAFIAPGASQ